MSYEDDETGDYRPEWMDDHAQHEGLGPRAGDAWARRRHKGRYPNQRWGATEQLFVAPVGTQQKRATVVATELYDTPCPIGYQLRFSLDGVSYSSTMPANCAVSVTLQKSFDQKAGAASETFAINPGEAQTQCQVIARQLTITMEAIEPTAGSVFVQAVACPLTTLDCAVVNPAPAPIPVTPQGFSSTTTTRYPANASLVQDAADPNRAYFCIVNQSTTDLFVALSDNVDPTPGAEDATIVLPGGVDAGYEIFRYTGPISWQYADGADAGSGYALVTRGDY